MSKKHLFSFEEKMRRIDYLIILTLSFVAFFSRFLLLEKFQSHWDGPQYSIALLRYSFEQATPAPPGYPFYIALGKFFHLFIHDPHVSMLAVSIFASMLGAIILYLAGKNMYHKVVGIIAAIIFLTCSTFYYFSLTPYGYELTFAIDVLLAYIIYSIVIKGKQNGILLGLVYGLSFGIRPQETLFIGPLVLLGFLFLKKRQKILATLLFILITMIWIIPLIYINNGIEHYVKINSTAAKMALHGHTFFQHIELIIKGFLLSFGIASAFLLYYLIKIFKHKRLPHLKWFIFYAVWIIPGLYFNMFIHSEHAGYQLSYLAAFFLLISFAIWKTTQKSKILLIFTIACIALFNLYWFFYDRDPQFVKPYRPTSFHYSDIRKNDLKVGSKIEFVQKKFDPKKTLLVSTEAMWRPYSYYLKNYEYIALYSLDNTQEPYRSNRIDAKDWNMHQYIDKTFTILVPTHITTVIFMDDAAEEWIKNYPHKTYHLPGNSTLTSISVSPNMKIKYGYHKIEVKK